MNDLIRLIRAWANARNIIGGSDAKAQYVKLTSEVGELAFAIKNVAWADICDGIGDSFVVLVIICAMLDWNMEQCCSNVILPWRENRKPPDTELQISEFMFLISSIGRLGDAILKNDKENGMQLVTDCIRNLRNIAALQGYTFKECVEIAYDEIKMRKGVMYNGVFVKGNDARYETIMAELTKSV